MNRNSGSDPIARSQVHAVLNRAARFIGVLILSLGSACAVQQTAQQSEAERDRAESSVVEIEMVAAPTTLRLLDGSELDVWAYNGQVPGPVIRVRLGQTLRVHFRNRLPQPTTVHWHGVRVPNEMDGVPGVTQPAVQPGGTFLYEFAPPDTGTYWFHPHVRGSEQVERGLFGVLIVEEPEPVGFSRDVVWVIDDWRLNNTGQIDPHFNTSADLRHDGRWGNMITVNGHMLPEEIIAPGERVRLRMLNVANGRIFAPDFGPLQARVLAYDGLPTDRPLPAKGIELSPGNRADIELFAPPELAGQRIRVIDRFTRRLREMADLVVSGKPLPAAAPVELTPQPPSIPRGLDKPDEVFQLKSRVGGPFGLEWTINGRAYRHENDAHFSPHEVAARLPLGKWARLRFWNDSYRLHPMHMHGVFFRVVEVDGEPVEEEHWRDTVLVDPQQTLDVVVQPQDLGLWMMHCHILEHAESGMMTLFEVFQE